MSVYLNCPSCRLSLRTRSREMARQCPRCLNRKGERHRMFVSPLPYRLLIGRGPQVS